MDNFGREREVFPSFILDPFLLIFGAMFAVWLTVRKFYRIFGRKKKILYGLLILLLTLVWAGAGLLYFDILDMPFLNGYGKGNYFMWNSGLEFFGLPRLMNISQPAYLDFFSSLNLFAIFILIVLYPAFLYLGLHAGYILFGRNEKQTGLIELLKP